MNAGKERSKATQVTEIKTVLIPIYALLLLLFLDYVPCTRNKLGL